MFAMKFYFSTCFSNLEANIVMGICKFSKTAGR